MTTQPERMNNPINDLPDSEIFSRLDENISDEDLSVVKERLRAIMLKHRGLRKPKEEELI